MVNNFIDTFAGQSGVIANKFYSVALRLFWLLAGIQFSWSCVQLGLKGEFSLVSVTQVLVREIMFLGFFFWLLTQYSNLGDWIVGGLRLLGGQATGMSNISPGAVFEKGIQIAYEGISTAFEIGILRGFAAIVPCAIILVAFAMAAAATTVYLIEFYIIVPAGVLLLGLGGSIWSKSYSEGYIRTLISVGMKLLCLQIVLGICINFMDTYLNDFKIAGGEGFFQHIFNLAGLALITWMVIQQVPQFAAALLSGGSFASGSALTDAAGATFGAVAGGAASAMQAGITGALAYSDAKAAFSGDGGGGGGGFTSEVGSITAGSSSEGGGNGSLSDNGNGSNPGLDSSLRGDHPDSAGMSSSSFGANDAETQSTGNEAASFSGANFSGATFNGSALDGNSNSSQGGEDASSSPGASSGVMQSTASSGTSVESGQNTATASDTLSSSSAQSAGGESNAAGSMSDVSGTSGMHTSGTSNRNETRQKAIHRAALTSAMRTVLGFGPTGSYTPGGDGAYRWGDMSSSGSIPPRMPVSMNPAQRMIFENMAGSIQGDQSGNENQGSREV